MDERRRGLEREAAGGEPAAVARLLSERVRLGEVDRAGLWFLALIQWEPAWLALGWERTGETERGGTRYATGRRADGQGRVGEFELPTAVKMWPHLVLAYGPAAALRMCAAAVRFRLTSWIEEVRESMRLGQWNTTPLAPPEAMAASRYGALLVDRCALMAGTIYPSMSFPHEAGSKQDHMLSSLASAAEHRLHTLVGHGHFVAAALRVCSSWAGAGRAHGGPAWTSDCLVRCGGESVHAEKAIRDELAAWVLGQRDPVRDRLPEQYHVRQDHNFRETVATRSDLPAKGEIDGEARYVEALSALFVWSESEGLWSPMYWGPQLAGEDR